MLLVEVRLYLDERQFDDLGAVAFEQRGELASLFACAGDHDSLSHQRAAFEPFGFGTLSDDFSNDDHGRGADACRCDIFDDTVDCTVNRTLAVERGPLDRANWHIAAHAACFEFAQDSWQLPEAHVEAERALALRVQFKVDADRLLFRIFMSSQERDGGAEITVGEGNAGISGGRECCGDAWHNLEGDLVEL